jgi:putative effector of murein hydrolase LrgA (UPF0299 family)
MRSLEWKSALQWYQLHSVICLNYHLISYYLILFVPCIVIAVIYIYQHTHNNFIKLKLYLHMSTPQVFQR